MNRALKTLIAALVIGAGVLAGNADARPVKFRVQIKASQTSNWNQPYFETANNCFNRPWRQGAGGEALTFKGSGIGYAQKVGRLTFWTYGSPNFGPTGFHGIPLVAKTDRHAASSHGNKPGPCGGGTPDEADQYQCGARSGKAWGQLSWDSGGKRLLLRAPLADGTEFGFSNCLLFVPTGVSQAQLTEISQKAPAKELLDPNFKKHIVIARKSFKDTLLSGGATITDTTTVQWQVTLTRLSR
jgi:hypothetical protein